VGSHGRAMIAFVKRQRVALGKLPTLLLSVSLSEAGAEDTTQPAEKREAARRDVDMMLERFYKSTGFRPARAEPVAGALMYSRYNPFVRFIMKRIARAAGASTDASRDHVFTNFDALTSVALGFADQLGAAPAVTGPEPLRTTA
jgi:menaquinone-dependent protoporphyrinogen oxidase